MILHSFHSEISYFPSSNKAELLAVISALIVLPSNSEVTIYTDSNNIITGYYDIIDRNNFIISPRKFFKIQTNNIYWSILREIIVTNNLTLDFIKVKGHSDDQFNNYINEFITHTDELSNLVFKPNNLINLDYIPQWNNIIIECNLCQFLKKKSKVQHWEKILNLNRNGKYRHPHVNVDWHYIFLMLNRDIEDKVESTYFTSIFSSKRKKQSVNLLTEEIPTVEKRKYLAHKIFDNWKCSFCEQHDETFDHVWMLEAKKDPIIDIELINKMTFWDRTYSKTKITFMDLIKGIISCESAAYTALIFENKKL
ncbi:ribonuclease H-like domain-containing protein [Rhizophagus irregularis DAOM 181602=DAOM 197198]|nr:ribonuclease H-like domain-containing protein [Rhizophagus irregularis DAOM 181602=DAOM 197198]